MPQTFDMILKNGTVHTPGGAESVDVGVRGGRIVAIGTGLGSPLMATGWRSRMVRPAAWPDAPEDARTGPDR